MIKNNENKEFTFSDVLLLPGYAPFEMAEESKINISSKLTKKIKLQVPIVSANMAAVTESKMAIAMAIEGGLGIIHQFMTDDRQLDEVRIVKKQNLPVGAAIFSYGGGLVEKVKKLVSVGCDVVVVDSANAHNLYILNLVQKIKRTVKVELVVGNVATAMAVKDLINAGADAVKVGIGPGSHCTTRIVTGVGRPQLSAIQDCSRYAKKYGISIIADGGITSTGDIVKALSLGANAVMIGGMFAGCDECPGEIVRKKGHYFKKSWGNCTKEAYGWLNIKTGTVRLLKSMIKRGLHIEKKLSQAVVEEGVSGLIPCKGSATAIIRGMAGSIRRGCWYVGSTNIKQLQSKAKFVLVSDASLKEAEARI